MLTVASPKVSDIEIELRAKAVARAVTEVRSGAPGSRATLMRGLSSDVSVGGDARLGEELRQFFDTQPGTGDARLFERLLLASTSRPSPTMPRC
jgi:hypothetical protein